MFAGPPRARPRPQHLRAAPRPDEDAGDAVEVSPLARIHRSRLAFALAATVAALPVVVLDNLAATAESQAARPAVSTTAAIESSSLAALSTTAPPAPTSTTAPPTTAPATTEAAPTTVAPAPEPTTTTAAPATTTAAPAPTAPATTSPPPPAPLDPDEQATWDALAECESGGVWTLNTGNGYYGGLQFSLGTWLAVGGVGYPHEASASEQIARGKILQAEAGWGQWPHCAAELGLL